MQLFLVPGLVLLGAFICQALDANSTIHPHHTHPPHHSNHTTHHVVHHTHGTHTPRPTHEPTEHEGFYFQYMPTTHKMYVKMRANCYIADLTADERTKVHTDSGIREIEVKLIQMLSIATNVTGHVDPKDKHVCDFHSHMKQYFTIP